MPTESEKLFTAFLQPNFIEQAALDAMPESALLEFKQVLPTDNPNIARWAESEQANCRESFGALANTFGGVVVWGVKSRERGKGEHFKVASEALPFRGVGAFLRQLNGYQPFDSPYAKLDHRPVYTDEAQDTGYVVSHVTLGDPLPVMSADRHYYTRSGSNNVRMSDPLVRALMLAQQVPSLSVRKAPGKRTIHQPEQLLFNKPYEWSANVILVNTGHVVLRDLSWVAYSDSPRLEFRGLQSATSSEFEFENFGKGKVTVYTLSKLALYPGASTKLFAVDGWFNPGSNINAANVDLRIFTGDVAHDHRLVFTVDDLTSTEEVYRDEPGSHQA